MAESDGADAALLIDCAAFHGILGALSAKSDPAGAEARFMRQAELDRSAIQREPGSQRARLDLAEALMSLAGLKQQPAESIALLRSGLRALDEKPAQGGTSTASMRIRASILVRLASHPGDSREALQSAQEANKLLVSVAALEELSGRSQEDLATANRIIVRRRGSNASQQAQR